MIDDWASLDPGASLLDALAAEPAFDAIATDVVVPAAAPAAAARRLVVFTVAGTTYAVPEMFVSEVARVPSITIVPRVPAWIRGITNLRGDIVSVVDLRLFLGFDATSPHTGRLLVVRLVNEDFAAGLLVDGVDQIANVAADAVRMPVSPIAGSMAAYLTGVCHVGERLVTVLDFDRFLRSPEIRQFERNDHATE